MKTTKIILWAVTFSLTLVSCKGQRKVSSPDKIVGGGCDGCELMFIDMPSKISSVDTSSGWHKNGQKLLLTGTVYNIDGRTPAPDVVLYYWQTDPEGKYSSEANQNPKTKRHGRIRGWVKTDSKGKYSIYTNRPGVYPDKAEPAHIHFSIKEPDVNNEYYPDDVIFDDDALVLPHLKKNSPKNRGGSGIVRILLDDKLQIAEHDIILGLNIPDYPKKAPELNNSGLNIGEDQPSFTPFHAYGSDRGTQTCPVCKYGRHHGILYFVGNKPDWNDIKKWLTFLEKEASVREKYLKVYFVYGNEKGFSKAQRQKELELLGKELNIKHTALTFVPSFNDAETEAHLNKINADLDNTFIIYKHRSIVDKYLNLKPSTENFRKIAASLSRTQSKYFNLQEPNYR